MFKLIKIEVLGYKDYVYKLIFECSDVKYIYGKFKLNARECLVNNVGNSYSIIAEVEKDKLFEVINILEDGNKRSGIFRMFLWVKSKVVASNDSKGCINGAFKYSDYEFLLEYYKTSIIDKFICKYTLSDKQVEYINVVLDDCGYDKYEEVLDELIGVFGIVEVESELVDKLDELGLEIDITSLGCNNRKFLLKVLSLGLFSNKFLCVLFTSCYNYEYLNFVFSLLIDNEVKVSVEIEKFIIGLIYECYEVDGKHLYTKFKKELLGHIYEV